MVCNSGDDWELLRAYADDRSEAAFTKIVERHISFVYATALRQVRDVHLAEDVAQAVFIVLARKAPTMRKGVILSSWLFRTARFAASDALKREHRRMKRESAAAEVGLETPDENAELQQVVPQLDEALASLDERDRRAVLLRFFEQKSLREVGEAFSIQEAAAKKRISRAVEKLRAFLVRRGIAVSGGALLAAIASETVRALPPGLAGQVIANGTGHSASVSASIATIVGAISRWMLYGKVKLVGLIALGVAAPLLVASMILQGDSASPTAYDLTRDFLRQANPNGVWSYGAKTSVGSPLLLLSYHRRRAPESWEFRAGVWPAIYHNNSSDTLIRDRGQAVYPPGAVWLAAGEDGTSRNFGVIRFTVPAGAGGKYRIESRARPGLVGPTSSDADFHVAWNGNELFGFDHPASATNWVGYTNTLALAAEDTVDLLVGRGPDGTQRGSVLIVEAKITALSTNGR
jgi:RNA polymerase sigma factor (sigma-70 family)